MNRREFLQHLALLSGAGLFAVGTRGWAARIISPGVTPRRLIVVFLRGAVDGLNVVVPYADDRYYDARPNIGVPKAGQGDGVLPLDDYFGLHPALAALLPVWRNRTLAFVHASGSPDPNRSHFEAQAYMESGTPGVSTTADGWMNRVLASLPGPHLATEAISLGSTLPRILSGVMPVANLPLGRSAMRQLPLDRPRVADAFDSLYAGNSALARAYQEGQQARRQLLGDLQQDMTAAANGAPSVDGFVSDTRRLAQLMASDASIRLGFLAVSGWDTHVNQGAAAGQLANHLKALADGLDALVGGLGDTYQETAIVVLSEFGRTFRENGNGGTDHGHGNVMWVLGGRVNGGRVYGEWPGLAPEQLYQTRDLAVTTDFRQVIAELLARHLRLSDSAIARVFPLGWQESGELRLVG